MKQNRTEMDGTTRQKASRALMKIHFELSHKNSRCW